MNIVGIKGRLHLKSNMIGQMKKDLLLFDKVGIIDLNLDKPMGEIEPLGNAFDFESSVAFFKSLKQEEYLFEVSPNKLLVELDKIDRNPFMPELIKIDEMLIHLKENGGSALAFIESKAIAFSIVMNILYSQNNIQYVPLVEKIRFPKMPNSVKTDVINLVIENMPVVDDLTPWANITDFKNNEDNKGKFAGLSMWMNKTANSGASMSEIKDELEYLLYQYRKSLELHKIKYHSGTLQRIVVGTAELIENAARLKFSNIAKGLFSVHQEKVELMQAELTAPGKEIAYIYHAQKTFG